VVGASRALNVTAPAITLQLRSIEETAGIPLLERTSEGYRPTAAGVEVLAQVRRIEACLADCDEALTALKGIAGGRVCVGVTSTAKYFAPQALAAFAKEHPKVEVRLTVGNRDDIVARLESYELDLAITGRPPKTFEVDNAAFGAHPFVIIGPPDHRLAGRPKLSLKDFSEEPFVLREHGSGTRALMEELFLGADITPRIGMQIGSNETIKQAVIAGLGIAVISAHTVAAEINDRRLVAFNVAELPVMRTWFVVKRADKRLLPAPSALWEFIKTSGSNFLPDTSKFVAAN
jgi:LysR family transcriptional regulator for metE and metH